MFKDYYVILEVDENVSQEEIKFAFKRQALKWHPDRNQGIDTTGIMQELNEAYLILKDIEARERYNQEYKRFKHFQQEKRHQQETTYQEQQEEENQQHRSDIKSTARERTYEYSDYTVHDEILNKWMNNAKQQAVEMAAQTIEDLKGMVSVGMKAAVREAGNQFIFQIIISIVILTIFALVKSYNN